MDEIPFVERVFMLWNYKLRTRKCVYSHCSRAKVSPDEGDMGWEYKWSLIKIKEYFGYVQFSFQTDFLKNL